MDFDFTVLLDALVSHIVQNKVAVAKAFVRSCHFPFVIPPVVACVPSKNLRQIVLSLPWLPGAAWREMISPERLAQLLETFRSKRLMVIGDLMLDEFLWGRVRRISPEAPVPVVEVTHESYFPGGAANVARNLREFTRHVQIVGLIGTCAHAARLKSLMAEGGIGLEGIIESPDHQTIVKTRIIARQQQVVRVDREKLAPLTSEQRENALRKIEKMLPGIDAIILEDYGKGLLTQEFLDAICAMAAAAGKMVTVDPNPLNPLDWPPVAAIKPNRPEAFLAARRQDPGSEGEPAKDRALLDVGKRLLQKWSPKMLLFTLGEQGMLLFEKDSPPYHCPTRAREVFDVSGAGDTAIALFTLALVSGATAHEAAEISNHASGVVVGKLGTATLTPAELLESFQDHA